VVCDPPTTVWVWTMDHCVGMSRGPLCGYEPWTVVWVWTMDHCVSMSRGPLCGYGTLCGYG
jgi:hypothetical protein